MTRSIWLNENRRTLSGAGSSCGLEAGLMSAAASFTLLSRFRKSSAPSSFSSCSVGLASESMLCVNFENLVSSSSGSSTFVMIKTMESPDEGIASIIRGKSSASNPKSKDACCIISRNRDFAFSVP